MHNGNGSMSIGYGNANGMDGVYATTTTFMPRDDTPHWYYIELQATINFSTGAVSNVTLVVDGTTRATVAGPFSAPYFNPVGYGFWSTAGGFDSGVCDVYLLDGTGSVNTTFIGDCRVENLIPTGAGANQAFALVGAGSHVAAVNDTTPDGDTGYLHATAVGQKETFVMSDLVSTSGTVKGVAVQNIAVKESSTARNFRGVVRLGGADYTAPSGPSEPWQGGYRPAQGIFEVSPATGTTWTASEVNSMEAGAEMVS